jgi:transcriptional regulator with XRE-family HTH domain
MLQRLGDKIRTLRLRRGMSQLQMGQQLGYADGSYISEVESGKKNPTAEFIFKVSQLFSVSADRLLDDRLDLPEEDG